MDELKVMYYIRRSSAQINNLCSLWWEENPFSKRLFVCWAKEYFKAIEDEAIFVVT
jgi:hypothetical protein